MPFFQSVAEAIAALEAPDNPMVNHALAPDQPENNEERVRGENEENSFIGVCLHPMQQPENGDLKKEVEFYRILQLNKTIKGLKLVGNNFNAINKEALYDYLQLSNIKELQLFFIHISIIDLQALSAMLKCSRINNFGIIYPDSQDIRGLTELLSENPKIIKFSIARFEDHYLIPLMVPILKNRKFKTLNLIGRGINDATVNNCIQFMYAHPRLKINIRFDQVSPAANGKIRLVRTTKELLDPKIVLLFRDYILRKYYEKTKDFHLKNEEIITKYIRQIARNAKAMDVILKRGLKCLKLPPNVEDEMDVIKQEFRITFANCIKHAILRWKQEKNLGPYAIMHLLATDNPKLDMDTVRTIRSFLTGGTASTTTLGKMNHEEDRVFLDNFCETYSQQSHQHYFINTWLHKSFAAQQRDESWIMDMEKTYQLQYAEHWKRKYNAENPGAEAAGFGPAAIVPYRAANKPD